MAKSRSFFGIRQGSTKTLTFQRGAGGQQITKDRVYEVSNPRTNGQQGQRAKFAECVQFYKRGVQNFFKFAYEDRKQNESDYNAFMRHNVGKSCYMTKEQISDAYVPMVGEFMMTAGSLATLKHDRPQEGGSAFFNASGTAIILQASDIVNNESEEGVLTIGTLSNALIRSYGLNGYQTGDILTIVHITSDATISTSAPYVSAGTTAPAWTMFQIRLDPTSTETVADEISVTTNVAGQTLKINEISDEKGLVCVVSRETPNGLLVSTQNIVATEAVSEAIATMQNNQSWIDYVLTSWGATGRAILQGALLGE